MNAILLIFLKKNFIILRLFLEKKIIHLKQNKNSSNEKETYKYFKINNIQMAAPFKLLIKIYRIIFKI